MTSCKPFSTARFEVPADDFAEMERHGRKTSSWGPNVYVKIAVTNTAALSSGDWVWRYPAANSLSKLDPSKTLNGFQ